jgi:hypothetical protein
MYPIITMAYNGRGFLIWRYEMRRILLFIAAFFLLVAGATDGTKSGHDFIKHHKVIG